MIDLRRTELWNQDWRFIREDVGEGAATVREGEAVTLPHTWNAKDGQDGGNDYYRGRCWYVKRFPAPACRADEEVWLEFRGAAMIAEVYVNGRWLARHEGGYSTFRVNLTEHLEAENVLAVSVDNGKNRTVYPQKADFTFYGGIYRDVYLLTVPAAHFSLEHFGDPGVKVTPEVLEDLCSAKVKVEASVCGAAREVLFSIGDQKKSVPVSDGYAAAEFALEPVRLWNGVDDPYLYQAEALLDSGDCVSVRFGCRRIGFDAEKGFLLNGRPCRLCGVARHQDRQGKGNALTAQEHEEDIALIREMGANTVRLAHYQHDQYMYELCDRYGLAVWAEIPYISEHMQEACANTMSQMTELIAQNYNHPSIICWSLSNEITAAGGVTQELVENHRRLNELCHRMDPTRPTAMANVNMLDPDDPLIALPDICSFNHYFGWYLGEMHQTGEWCDEFHQSHPRQVVGISEFGADANPAYQSGSPKKGDWSEGYQAIYHENMLQMWSERPWLWAVHCWNMFDFGADGRDGGGKPGQNQKGLVTFDRKIKKDAFYIYKAWLSREPFVHLCGRRYADRCEERTEIKVYSNQPEVTLLVDGQVYETRRGDKIFSFIVPITQTHRVEAVSGALHDEMTIRRTSQPNPSYRMDGGSGEVTDWFDRDDEILRDGYFSIKDSMAEVKGHPEARAVLEKLMAPIYEKVIASFGGDAARMVKVPKKTRAMMDRMSVEATLTQMGQMVPKQFLRELNHALNQVKKPV